MPNVRVNREKCEGYGNCVLACPGVFDIDDGGLVIFDSEAAASASMEDLRRGAYDCPTESIVIED
ncbi:ferredoxin [Nocardia sp. NPDC004860]|uniref:ferredoxin n=1 Tax=Nocardia sp. NPDC004860 TaxID=3154557 RepID=UPI0033BDD1C8